MNETRNYVNLHLSKYLDNKKSQNIEKSILNFAIDYANENDIEVSWESLLFTHIYKQKFISVISLISDNKSIVQKINSKEILTKSFASINIKDIHETEHIEDEEIADGLFTCRKCGSKKTTYYSLQTRSADEPMTNFITCTGCENRWKM